MSDRFAMSPFAFYCTYSSSNKDSSGNHYSAVFDTCPFAEGSFRKAYKGTVFGTGPRSGERCVVKIFKDKFADTFEHWLPDLAAIQKAQLFAEQFNRIPLASVQPKRRITFTSPLIAETFYCGDNYSIKPPQFAAIEPYLDGPFVKFNSNYGFEDSNSKLLPAFSHWTFEISGHSSMICDLQGIKTDREYVLTDPAVHSSKQLFLKTMTDLGVSGMQKVLEGHNCNFICKELGLATNPVPHLANQLVRRTSYNFEISYEQKQQNYKKHSPFFEVLSEEYSD